jgi:hypothetical protein
LLSYGPALVVDDSRRAASYVDRILRGEKPGDLPVQFPTKFEMVVNRKTAKALGLAIPPSILLRADELIEVVTRRPRNRTSGLPTGLAGYPGGEAGTGEGLTAWAVLFFS